MSHSHPSCLLPVVVGAHLRAEMGDRPSAYALRERLASIAEGEGVRLAPVVVTDLWYLNQDVLRVRPTVSVGNPEINALSAALASRLPSALAIDDRLLVQFDPEWTDQVACCWGVDHQATARAAGIFAERYAQAFVRAAARITPG